MESWLRFWFQHCTHGHLELCWGDPQDDGKPKNAMHFRLGEEAAMAAQAAALNAIPGCNVYFGTATVSNDRDHRSGDKHFVQSPGIWGDADRAEDIEAAGKVESILRPSAVIITGRHPHLRRQTYHRFSSPLRDADEVRSLNRRVFALYGGDSSVTNPVRVMRLPGSIAWPYKSGRIPEMTSWTPAADSTCLSYAFERVALTLPPEPAPEPSAQQDSGPDESIADLIAGLVPGNWHDTMIRIVAKKVKRGEADAEIHLIDERLTLFGHTLDDTWHDVQVAIDTFRRKTGLLTPHDAYALKRQEEAASAFGAVPLPEGAAGPAPPGAPFAQGAVLSAFRPALEFDDAFDLYGRPPRFLVHGFLQVNATAMITGLPGVGKSPLVQYLAACLSYGFDFNGMACEEAATYYWGAESVNQTVRNIARFAQALFAAEGEQHDIHEIKRLLRGRVRVQGQGGLMIDEQAAAIAADVDKLHADSGKPVMLVIDTLRSVAKGGVTSDEDMARVQQALLTIREGRDWLTVPVLHHAPKSDPEGTSGSNRLDGLAEIIISVVPAMKRKPGAADEDDDGSGLVTAKRLMLTRQPDAEGYKHAWMRVVTRRNKDWQPASPISALLSVRDDEARLAFGRDAEGVAALMDVPLTPVDPEPEDTTGFAAQGRTSPVRGQSTDPAGLAAAVRGVLSYVEGAVTPTDLARMLADTPFLAGADAQVARKRMQRALEQLRSEGVAVSTGVARATRWRLA
ncbi:MAG: AAA family ATPase [Rhodospirillales bacterium]|nr:AAA family ATPase [Rhodospirillales bacterium]